MIVNRDEERVLVVNDVPDQLELMSVLLRQSGYGILTAADGRAALEVASAAQPDLIIADVLMPYIDGIELCRLIRAQPAMRLTPILLVSAIRKDNDSVLEGLKAGADDYLEAPYEPMRLVAKVTRLLERKWSEEALRHGEARFRALIENSSDIITILGADGTIRYESPSIKRVLGYEPEELVGRNAFDLVHPEDRARVIEVFNRVMGSGGSSQYVEYHFQHQDGSWCVLESVGKTFVDESGELVGVVNSRDIMERKRAEEKLRQSEHQLAEAQRLAHVGSWHWDVQNNVVLWSDELYRIFGLRPQELDPTYESFLALVHPEDRATVARVLESALRNQASYTHYFRIIRPDGQVGIVYSSGRVESDEHGEPLRMIGTTQDVTEQRLARERLKSSAERLRALSARLQSVREEERTMIARELHDDLGGALTGLKMDLSWLARRLAADDDETIRERLRAMSAYIDATIQKVRDISTELRPSVLDDLGLAAAIDWQAREFQRRTEIECRIVSVEEVVRLSQEKATAVFRIFQEILTNIARHACASLVEISLKEQTGNLILTVSDNGRGIQDVEVSAATSIGLLGMRERALVFGGHVEISGSPGQGTTVIVRIPHE